MKTTVEILSNNIRWLRKKASISQEELADKAGLHRTYIGAIERGERNISILNIEKIAFALNIEPYKLIKENIYQDIPSMEYITSIKKENFNPNCNLPYSLNVHDICKAMNDFLDFLKYINLQLSKIKIPKLEYLLMPANFSSIVGEFIINSIPKYCKKLAKNNFHNGHPDLIPKGKYKNNAVQYSKNGIEIKASRHTSGWQGHNPENIWLIVFCFKSNSVNDILKDESDIPFGFKGVYSAYLKENDWNFSGRAENSRRTITASINKNGVRKMKENWIYKSM